MTRTTNRLTDRAAKALKKPGRHADGGNLYLTISKSGAGLSKRWTFLYTIAGKQHEPGLGAYPKVSLAEAREKAARYRSLIERGIDPLEAKQSATEAGKALAARQTFGQCAEALHKSKRSGWQSAKGAYQWIKSLTEYCAPVWDTPVETIDTAAVLTVLTPVWSKIPVTAKRVQERMEAVLDYAKALKLRSGENPAAWRGHLALILPKRQKLGKVHHAALDYNDVPEFVATLRESTAAHAAVLEFAILTACRSAEALGALWTEIDLAAKLWTIPAARMKAGVAHRVPLARRAVEIIEKQAAIRSSEFVFPGLRTGKALSPSSLRLLGPAGATVHGFRSSFRDWCGEETSFPREVAESALAHASGDATERAYRRGDALEKRRALMEAWASFCEPGAASNVVSINKAV